MAYSSEKQFPETDSLWTIAFVLFLFSSIIGAPIVNKFNEINPWIICEWPTLTSFIIVVGLAIWIRRRFYNLMF